MVNVIGLGYIGLPTALMMASHGVEVVQPREGGHAEEWQDHIQREGPG